MCPKQGNRFKKRTLIKITKMINITIVNEGPGSVNGLAEEYVKVGPGELAISKDTKLLSYPVKGDNCLVVCYNKNTKEAIMAFLLSYDESNINKIKKNSILNKGGKVETYLFAETLGKDFPNPKLVTPLDGRSGLVEFDPKTGSIDHTVGDLYGIKYLQLMTKAFENTKNVN